MNESLLNFFEKVAQDTIMKASTIDECPTEDYIEGLEIIIQYLKDEIEASRARPGE